MFAAQGRRLFPSAAKPAGHPPKFSGTTLPPEGKARGARLAVNAFGYRLVIAAGNRAFVAAAHCAPPPFHALCETVRSSPTKGAAMADEGTVVTTKSRKRAGKQSLIELEERVKMAELHAREAEANVRLNAARRQLSADRQSRKIGKKGAR